MQINCTMPVAYVQSIRNSSCLLGFCAWCFCGAFILWWKLHLKIERVHIRAIVCIKWNDSHVALCWRITWAVNFAMVHGEVHSSVVFWWVLSAFNYKDQRNVCTKSSFPSLIYMMLALIFMWCFHFSLIWISHCPFRLLNVLPFAIPTCDCEWQIECHHCPLV